MIELRHVAVLVFCLATLIVGCSGPRIAQCKTAVERHLTSPGSAAWGDFEIDEGALEVDLRGRVDSDNAYGASQRTYFVCRFKQGKPARVTLGDRPFDDLRTRLSQGRPIIDWR